MTRRLLYSAVIALVLPSLVSAVGFTDRPSSAQSDIVVCVLRPGEPWKEASRGTLVSRSSKDRVDYSLTAGNRSFEWWWMRNPDGSYSGRGAPSLWQTFAPDIQKPEPLTFPRGPIVIGSGHEYPGPHRVSSNDKGEIRETIGSFTVISVIGTACPK